METIAQPLLIVSVVDFAEWESAIYRAVAVIERESPSGYTVHRVVRALRDKIERGECIVLVCVDLSTGKPVNDSVCGVSTLEFGVNQPVGAKVATLVHGWVANGYAGRVAELAIPIMVEMAKEQGCDAVYSYTRRNADAYERWIAKWGFQRAETRFELKLRGYT